MRNPRLPLAMAVVIAALHATVVAAAPISTQVSFNVTNVAGQSPGPLQGGRATLTIQWDASVLSPISDTNSGAAATRFTSWPISNTTARLTIVGSVAANGIYDTASFPGEGWILSANLQDEVLNFPPLAFAKGDLVIGIERLRTFFHGTYGQGPPNNTATLYPEPFTNGDVKFWTSPNLTSTNAAGQNLVRYAGGSTSGFAVAVPEPSVTWIACGGLAVARVFRTSTRRGR